MITNKAINNGTLRAAMQREKAAWNRYRTYCVSRFYEDNKFLRDEASIGLFGEWQILYEVRRSLTPKPRRYRKGGLNLCRS